MSSILTKIVDSIGGGIIKEGFNAIKAYFPPSMTDQEKAAAELAYNKFAHQKEIDLIQQVNAAEKEFNQRIKDLEGTAADLKSVPVVGHIILLLRGAQRPVWGFFVLFADYQVLSMGWDVSDDGQLKAMLFAINILVLAFLFGERAVKNVMPFILQFFGLQSAGKK
jgi:hypothetical protein